jgi:general secretion pathway protein D
VTSNDTDTKQPPSDPKAAKQSYLRGREAEKSSDWRAAYEAYSLAVNEAPGNKEYDLRRALARSRLVQDYVDRAERDAVANRMLQARAELSAAIALDPGDEAARERWRELSPQETIIKDDRPDSLASPVQLEPQPGTRTFDLKGSTQQAYQAVAKEFGVKVSFDVDLRTRNVRLRLADVTFQTAMKVLGPMTGTFWKPLGKNLFFVADDNPQKRRDYDTSIVRTIILPASALPKMPPKCCA